MQTYAVALCIHCKYLMLLEDIHVGYAVYMCGLRGCTEFTKHFAAVLVWAFYMKNHVTKGSTN